FNGDIYNSNELLHQLKKENSDCTVASDVELIKELFTTYKENLFQYLRGKFAIVIWDKVDQTLYGARDHFGIKTLFYRENEDEFILSTRKKGVSFFTNYNKVSHQSLQHYLSFQYVPEPMTMTSDIYKIEPGHYFIKKLNQDVEISQ